MGRSSAAEAPPQTPDSDQTGEPFQSQLQLVARNLLALEVNTIIKEGMTATGMPATPHALIDIANEYDAKLKELGAAGEHADAGVASHAVFDALRARAARIGRAEPGARRRNVDYTQSTLLMLSRIQGNSDQLKGLFASIEARGGGVAEYSREHAPAVNLTPAELMLVRKIWEIGTEEIAMQTVIQLDGDIVTRLQKAYARAKDAPLVAVHNSAVATSVGTWNKLVDTLGAFMNGLAHLFVKL
jgi:hypothetical protein